MRKLERLKDILLKLETVIVAFSGGLDSSFLLKMAKDVLGKDRILAVTAISDTYPPSELEQAKRFAKSLGARHRIIFTREMEDKNFTRNQPDRCYYCKKELFKRLKEMADRVGFKFVLDASNLDDKKDFRPGSKAKKEFGVVSPLEMAGLTKNEIRRYSRKMKLKTWSLPSMACLASRIPYGGRISRSKLEKIEKAERFIKNLGVNQVRVRYYNDTARIEVGKEDIKRFFNQRSCDKIRGHLKTLGFSYVTLDLEGYRTGSLNEVLK